MNEANKPTDHRAVAETFLAMARLHLDNARVNVRIAEMLISGRVPETESGVVAAATGETGR